MATQTIIKLVDDLDNSEAAESVSFGLDGVLFSIDLSVANAAELRAILAPYIAAGTKVTQKIGPRPINQARTHRDRNQHIRDWAINNGIDICARGRIPASVIARYEAAARRTVDLLAAA